MKRVLKGHRKPSFKQANMVIDRRQAIFTTLPPASTLVFGPDGGLANITPPTDAANIVFEGPEGANVRNQITIETLRTTGRVKVITPNPWN